MTLTPASTAAPATALPHAAAVHERTLLLRCEGEQLLAVLATPAAPATPAATPRLGVLIIVGGPQYRAGSHRQFVHLARALAAAGWPALRFDVRGMGDSSGSLHDFEHISPDIGAAIDGLCAATGVEQVVLWGLCDGASAALLYAHERADARVAGLCLVNPWARSATSLARTHVKHYYLQRLGQREFWRKLLRGGVALDALRGFLGNLRAARQQTGAAPAAFQTRMALGWRAFSGPILLVLSGEDYTAQEFVEYTSADADWQGLMPSPLVIRHLEPAADHTFAAPADRKSLEQVTLRWLENIGT